MLFVALTRASIHPKLESYNPREISVRAGWLLTLVADGFLSKLQVSDRQFCAREALGISLATPIADFLTASFDQEANVLEIVKTLLSGRPAYYHVSPSGDFYLSTHICMLRRAGVVIEEDIGVLPELFIYRTVAPPRTLFRAIKQLSASGRLLVRPQREHCEVTLDSEYSLPKTAPAPEPNLSVFSDQVVELLAGAVTMLDPLTSRLALLLSGGLDSSILCRSIQKRSKAIETFSTAYPFEDPDRNLEKQYAVSSAEALSVNHTHCEFSTVDYLVGFLEAVAAAETPLNHLQSVLLHLLFKNSLPNDRDTIISAAMADCAFGTPAHFTQFQATRLRNRILSTTPALTALQMLGMAWSRAHELAIDIQAMRAGALPLSNPGNPLWNYASYGDYDWVQRQYQASHEDVTRARREHFHWDDGESLSNALSKYDLECDMGPTIATWSKLAEAQGKLVYYPFAKKDLVDYALSIPWDIKLKSPKHILRAVARQLGVPEFIIERPKIGFGVSSDRWAKPGGIFEVLVPMAAKVMDVATIRELQGGNRRSAMTFWTLLNYAVWKRLFILNESKELLLEELMGNFERLPRK